MRDENGEQTGSPEMTGRRTALVGGLWNAAQMVLPMVGTVLLSIALGRKLGPELLGVQSLISYGEALLAGLLVMSLQKASLQAISAALGSSQGTRARQYERWTMLGQTLNGLVSAAVLVTAGGFSSYPWAWYLAAATALADAVTWGYAIPVIARSGHWTSIASRRLWTQLLGQFAAAIAVLFGAGLVAVFAANLVSALLLLFIVRPLAGPLGRSLGQFPRALARLWGLFGLRALLVQVVAQRIEFLFLAVYSTPDQIAMYSIPFMVVAAVVDIPIAIVSASMPALAARESAGEGTAVAEHLGSAVRVTVAASIPLALGVTALGPTLIVVLYGSAYTEAGQILAWMAPILLVLPAASVCETYWYGTAALRLPLTTAVVAAVVDLALCFALIPRFEALGAAWANVAAQGTAAILLLVRTHQARPTVRLRWSRTVTTSAVIGAVAVAAWSLTTVVPGLAGLLAGTAVGLAGCAAYGRFIGFVAGEDATWLFHTLPLRMRRLTRFVTGPIPVAE